MSPEAREEYKRFIVNERPKYIPIIVDKVQNILYATNICMHQTIANYLPLDTMGNIQSKYSHQRCQLSRYIPKYV